MDIGLPTSSPSGVNFIPSPLLLAPNSVQPWAESNDLNLEFMVSESAYVIGDYLINREAGKPY